jgi:hypothetical protein
LEQTVVARFAEQDVAVALGTDGVVAGPTEHDVGSAYRHDHVSTGRAEQNASAADANDGRWFAITGWRRGLCRTWQVDQRSSKRKENSCCE